MTVPTVSQADVSIKQDFVSASKAQVTRKKPASRITLRLTEDELVKLKNLSNGISLSAYVRECLFGKDVAPRRTRSRVAVKDQEALAQVLGLPGQTRIANNLNQIAYEANCGSLLMDEETEYVPASTFEKAIADIENKIGLAGQPRVIVFHEKEGRKTVQQTGTTRFGMISSFSHNPTLSYIDQHKGPTNILFRLGNNIDIEPVPGMPSFAGTGKCALFNQISQISGGCSP